uniref:Uncharacterized protein n=1 Tax=Tanacetum cinerariifolium TaxID=118510 RepID=A0A6L2KXU3_TANCI|nr:hypothetical protein [Tanacetum cinerariifolium]
MNTTQAQQKALDDDLVAPADHHEFRKCNMRLHTDIKPKEATFQVVLDTHGPTPFYQAFLITVERAFATIINKCLSGKETGMDKILLSSAQILWGMFYKKNIDYVYLLWEDFLFQIEYKDAKKTNKISYPKFTKIIIDYFMIKDQSISRRNKMFWHTTRDETMFTSMRYIFRHKKTQVYGTLDPEELTKQAMLESKAYKTYYAFASREKTLKPNKKDFHILHASGSGDGVDTQSKVPDEQQQKTYGTYEGTSTIPRVLDVPIYDSESDKESWGDSAEEDDDEDDFKDNNDGSSDDHDDDSDEERTKFDRDEIPDPNLTNVDQTEHEEEDVDERVHTPSDYEITDDEKIHDEENIDEEEDDEVTKELYDDKEEEDAHVTLTAVLDTHNTGGPTQSSSVSSNFTSKLLNLDNPSSADNEIASLMDTTAHHATIILEITSSFTTTTPPPPLFFNPLSQQATTTPAPTTSEPTTSFHALPDFDSVFKFNERVTNLEKDLSEMKQVDQYAKALSLIPAIVDRYIDNKLGEAINKAMQARNFECREEAHAKKKEYIELVDSMVRTIIKEEVNSQLLQILPQAISDVVTPVIKKNITESLEAAVLTRSSSQPQSSYEAAATLSEFELTKIIIDKIEKNKSFDIADNKRELYDALVKSYNTDNDIYESYGEVFSLNRSRDDKDKDQDPSTGSNRGTKRRNSSKEAEPSRDSRSKEKKSSSISKYASKSQHKSFGKSAHAEEPSHTLEDSGMQHDQEFVTGDNDEKPADKEVTKADWFKKNERPPTPDPD